MKMPSVNSRNEQASENRLRTLRDTFTML